ncbi:MAG: hypothetical protein M3336_04735 [Chloroflexota bacterium]|nr:hypothetical protein [Chloroflexota bacterium]
MKLLTTLLIACLAGLAIYSVRRRLWLALRTAGIVYVVVLFVRLALSAGSLADRWDELAWPLLGMVLVWAVLWAVSRVYAHRKAARSGR